MKKTANLLLGIVWLALAAGCATSNQSHFTSDTVSQIKAGMSKADVTGMLGEPRSRLVDNAGDETWQYRKDAPQGNTAKTFSDIMSFGITTGMDAEYQDILTVTFKTNVVSHVTYQENVDELNSLQKRD